MPIVSFVNFKLTDSHCIVAVFPMYTFFKGGPPLDLPTDFLWVFAPNPSGTPEHTGQVHAETIRLCISLVSQMYMIILCHYAKAPSMRWNQSQSGGNRYWKQRHLHIFCLLAHWELQTHTHPCRVTAVSTSPKSTILRGGTNATGDTYTQKHTIHNNTHFAKAKWWPLTGVGLTELANELTMSVSNQQ